MDVQVARDRLETAQHRLGIAGDHCDGSENVETLKARKAKSESRTLKVLGTRLQQADERVDGDEAVRLLFSADVDTEARQERPGVAAQFAHQIAVTAQGRGADQTAHKDHLSENDKKLSETVKTRSVADGHSVWS